MFKINQVFSVYFYSKVTDTAHLFNINNEAELYFYIPCNLCTKLSWLKAHSNFSHFSPFFKSILLCAAKENKKQGSPHRGARKRGIPPKKAPGEIRAQKIQKRVQKDDKYLVNSLSLIVLAHSLFFLLIGNFFFIKAVL